LLYIKPYSSTQGKMAGKDNLSLHTTKKRASKGILEKNAYFFKV